MNAKTLGELLADHEPQHSDFKLDCFVVGRDTGTAYGQYLQVLRELSVRVDVLQTLCLERAQSEIAVEEFATSLGRKDAKACDRHWGALELTKRRIAVAGLGRRIESVCAEFARLYQQAVHLKTKLGELTPERRSELERATWIQRIKQRVALDMATIGRIDIKTLETLMLVPREMRQAVLADGPGSYILKKHGPMIEAAFGSAEFGGSLEERELVPHQTVENVLMQLGFGQLPGAIPGHADRTRSVQAKPGPAAQGDDMTES